MNEKQNVKLFWVIANKETLLGYAEKILLPDGNTIHFDHEQKKIDFEPVREYIGSELDYYVDGEHKWTSVISDVVEDKNGLLEIEFRNRRQAE